MKIMQTIMLAGFAAASVGLAAANAQSLTPGGGERGYYQDQGKTAAAPLHRGANAGQ